MNNYPYAAGMKRIRRNIIFGAIVNAILSCIKIVAGIWGQSHALFADGIHSISDIGTDMLVYIASYYSSQAADKEHPYGHGRFETLATSLLAIVLILAAFGIVYDSFLSLIVREQQAPAVEVLWIALFSILSKEFLYQYTRRIAIQENSKLLLANAWHHRSDAASSVVVLIAVVGTMFGFTYLDPIAALIVGGMILKMAFSLIRTSIMELVDTAVPDEVLNKIKAVLVSSEGINEVHQLRTRSIGGRIFVDVHALVSPRITVSEGHFIGQRAHYNLLNAIPEILDVTVHIDPEDDEKSTPSRMLKSRSEVMNDLKTCFHSLYASDRIQHVNLHYLEGNLHIEVFLPMDVITKDISAEDIQQSYTNALHSLHYIGSFRILYTVNSNPLVTPR